MNFKVGDWVRVPKYNRIFEFVSTFTEDDTEYISDGYDEMHGPQGWAIDEVELWIPQPGEYVWFWKMHNKELLYMFGKFSHHNQFGYTINEDDNGSIFSSKLRYWDNCEPFINSLPSFIKDK